MILRIAVSLRVLNISAPMRTGFRSENWAAETYEQANFSSANCCVWREISERLFLS